MTTCLQRCFLTMIVVSLTILFVYLSYFLLPIMINLKYWFLANTLRGITVFVASFTILTFILMPYTPFAVSAGYIWGPIFGFALQSLAIFTSSAAIFFFTQKCLLNTVSTYMEERYAKLWAIATKLRDDWVTCAKLNVLLCFVPMPYAIHVYLFAATQCSFIPFIVFFQLGMALHTALQVSVGHSLDVNITSIQIEIESSGNSWDGDNSWNEAQTTELNETWNITILITTIILMIFAIWAATILAYKILEQYKSDSRHQELENIQEFEEEEEEIENSHHRSDA